MAETFEGQVELLHLDSKQVKVLSSVACSEVFSSFLAEKALSIREVGIELGKSAAAVGEHVAALVACGLLIQVGQRKRRSRIENLYVHKGIITRFVLREHDWETIETYFARFRGQMRLAERQHELAQKAIHHDPDFQKYMAYKWGRVYLTPENAQRVQQAIASLHDLIQSLSEPAPHDNDDKVVRATFTSILLPSLSDSRQVLEE